MRLGRISATFAFLWFDMWVGVFVKKSEWSTHLYICPLPCCVFVLAWPKQTREAE